MKSCKNTDRTSKDDSGNRSLVPSVAKLDRLIGPFPTHRMLRPYEIELLRKSKREMDQIAGEIFAATQDESQS